MDALCGPLCDIFSILPCKCKCCDNICGCSDPLDGFFNIPDSDLEILRLQHRPDTYYLMTAAKRKIYEQQSGTILSFDKEVLDSIKPADRIVFTDVKVGARATDSPLEALKVLMRGIQENEARYILGGDSVSVDGLAAQGITTAEQLRTRRFRESAR
ncbi:hypothetical protein M408DRAFT_109672 [Serendipita vermifera MAFF 305830]|uniref:Uncharacterized protein n=1 Tax=Serendipita vermifera MAFF 305830 TaxID=933852 RepID=A0A0C3A9F2_SERVB|nr:hypothetical protein M408DRAFT_109672 [Serendipita vermifera MAFF 305830]